MIGAGDNGHITVRFISALADDGKGVLQVLGGGGGLVLQQDPLLGDPMAAQPVPHGLRLGDGLAGAHAAGDNHKAVGIGLQIVQRALQAAHQGQGGPVAVDRRAENDQVGALGVLVGAGVFDDGHLHGTEIEKSQAGQAQQDPPEDEGQKAVGDDQQGDEGQRIAPVGIAPQGKAQHQRRGQQSPGGQDPGFSFLHELISSHFSYSARSWVFSSSFCASISISF